MEKKKKKNIRILCTVTNKLFIQIINKMHERGGGIDFFLSYENLMNEQTEIEDNS